MELRAENPALFRVGVSGTLNALESIAQRTHRDNDSDQRSDRRLARRIESDCVADAWYCAHQCGEAAERLKLLP